MLYTENFRIRWHDTDANREVRPTEILAYMQESANHQFAYHAQSLDDLRDSAGVGFILSRIAIDFLSPLHAYEDVEVRTATCEGHGFCFPRRFEICREGEVVARAMSQWGMVRVADRTLLRVADAPLAFGDEPAIETQMPLRFRAPRELVFEQVGQRRITYSDLDYNMHMNNTKYPDMVCDFLPDAHALQLTGMSISYLREAAFGAVLQVERATDGEGTWYFRALCDGVLCMEAMLRAKVRQAT